MKEFGLSRNKSLKSKIIIDKLFTEGKTIAGFPIRLVYIETDFLNDENFLVGFSVPKKKFKKAVDRNRIKRLMREAFRLQQNQLILPKKTAMMWLFTGKEIPDYQLVFNKIEKIINKLSDKNNK